MDGLGLYAAAIQGLLFGLAMLVVIGGLDDLIVDIAYLVFRFRDRAVKAVSTEEGLKAKAEQPIAVMVPAWREAGVIGGMLDNLLRSFDYRDYAVFVGVYPNDPATEKAVEAMRGADRRIHVVTCSRPGPTSKGDCLNAIYRTAVSYGERADRPFAAYVLHDSEDVVHPLELRLFNSLIPARDMVQIPVLPLERRLTDVTGGHYIDEFAEGHSKELVVRERLMGVLPSAGVGCAFSARALKALAEQNHGDPFDSASVTEDYEIGIRLSRLGMRQCFMRFPVRRTARRGKADAGVVATREFFPGSLTAACRQKSRWQLGITFQGWQNFAWSGNLPQRYALWRDRKGHFAAHIGMLCYLALASTALYHGIRSYLPDTPAPEALITRGSPTWWLLLIGTVFLLSRSLQRATAVWRHYGWAQALLSVPRQLWGHVINFVAGIRALAIFIHHKVTGCPIGWDKTSHSFPTATELAPFRRRLGDLLVERHLVSRADLEAATLWQSMDARPLGTILLDQGAVDEDALFDVLAAQQAIRRVDLDPLLVPPEVLALVPRWIASRYSIFPVSLDPDGTLVVASDRIVTSRRRNTIATELHRRLEFRLATRSDLAAAIRWGYEKSSDPLVNEPDARLIKRLIDGAGWSAKDLKEARKRQKRAYRSLGSILVRDGVLSQDALDTAIEGMAPRDGVQLGEYLVKQRLITRPELTRALAMQNESRVPLALPVLDVAASA